VLTLAPIESRARLPGGDREALVEILARSFPRGRIERMLLITPPDAEAEHFRLETAQRRRYPNFPPYGLATIATHLRASGVEVEILNLNHEILQVASRWEPGLPFDFDAIWQSRIDATLARVTPDMVGVTCMFTMTHASLRRVCEYVARAGVPIAIGGVHVSNDVDRVLDAIPCARFAFVREGDLAIRRFVDAVAGRVDFEQLGQLVINDAPSGRRIHLRAECRPEAPDLDVMPAYELIEVAELSQYGVIGNFHGFKAKGTRFATCLTNRGCRAQCTFCSVRNFNGKPVRQRSVESVLDELQMLVEVYGIEHIMWLDDDLLKDHRRAIALFDGMVARGLGLTWDATNGVIAASCTEAVVAAMAASGCIALNIGMESGNPEVLRRIKKPGTVKNFLAAAEILRRHEQIHARVFLMLGFPDETLAQINDTIEVAREMDLDWCGITVLQPLPNTAIYNAMVEQGLLEPVGSASTRFNSGGYGKQDQIDMGIRAATQNFEEAFCAIPMDAVPNAAQLDDIWFFMNYHLNFHRLFAEHRPGKLSQQLMNLAALSDVISPEHGFALYFSGYLQHRLDGAIAPELIERLERRLARSPYWNDRFQAFGLSVDDLRSADFGNKTLPRLLPGRSTPACSPILGPAPQAL
jgi:radical SAM superfamily enzyme YgiQ (UPF0313 family)